MRRSDGALPGGCKEFDRHNAVIVGISVDGVWCHRAFAEARHLQFPLLADFEPKGAAVRDATLSCAGDGVRTTDLGGTARTSEVVTEVLARLADATTSPT